MTWVVFNTLLYLIAFVVIFLYKKRFDEGCLLLLVYLITAICNNLYYVDHENYYNHITFFPFLYLFVVLMLFFRPYITKKTLIVDKLNRITPSSKQYKILLFLCILYIVFTIISAYYSFGKFTENLVAEAWNEIYGNEDKFESPYVNFLDGIAKRYTDYLRPVILLFSFYLLAFFYEKKRRIVITIIVAVIFSSMMAAVSVASRGNIINIMLNIVLCYLIFKGKIPHKVKKYIYLFFGLISSIFLIYIISVTVSRFGEGDEAIDSVVFYAGHSMLTFNDGIYDLTKEYCYGTYFFSYFVELFDSTPIPPDISSKANYLFFTFVGSLYLDFPPFIIFIIAIIFPIFISHLCNIKKKKIDFANLYMYFFYLSMLAKGFTVGSPNEGFLWVVAFLIFGGLKFMFKF